MPRLTEDLLGTEVITPCGWLPFWRAYFSGVDRANPELRAALRTQPKRVKLNEWWFLPNGYILSRAKGDVHTYALYDNVERSAYNAHVNAWADFARGTWLSIPPTRSGTYPVRDRQGARGADRVIQDYQDTLIDVSGGYVGPGKVTAYVGDFWSVPYPPLPGAW